MFTFNIFTMFFIWFVPAPSNRVTLIHGAIEMLLLLLLYYYVMYSPCEYVFLGMPLNVMRCDVMVRLLLFRDSL